VAEQMLGHFFHTLEILVPSIGCGVGNEDDGVGVLEKHLPCGGIETLSRDGNDLEAKLVAAESGRREGKQIEEDRSVLGRVDGDQVETLLLESASVKRLEIRRLSARRRTVV
jgi:hypothetical protein